MKATIFAIVALATGIAIGIYSTRRELKTTDVPDQLRGVISATAANSSPAAALAAPKVVVVNGERFLFGVMDRSQTRTHEFIIRNEGGAPLTLVRGATTCKCTTSELPNDQVMPGEEVKIRLEWKPNAAELSFEQSAQFTTNDPMRRILHLVISGSVIDVIKVQPNHVVLGEVPVSEGLETEFKLLSYRNEPLNVTKFEWSDPAAAAQFDVSFEPLTAAELPQDPEVFGGLKAKVEFKPGAPLGKLERQLKVWTNLQPDVPVEIPFEGTVVGDIRLVGTGASAERQLVVLSPVSRERGVKQTVYLIVKGPHRAETQLRLTDFEPQQDFRASLGEPIRENERVDRYPLTIEIPPGASPVSRASPGSYALIHIETTHPDIKELTVKVRYVVKD